MRAKGEAWRRWIGAVAGGVPRSPTRAATTLNMAAAPSGATASKLHAKSVSAPVHLGDQRQCVYQALGVLQAASLAASVPAPEPIVWRPRE